MRTFSLKQSVSFLLASAFILCGSMVSYSAGQDVSGIGSIERLDDELAIVEGTIEPIFSELTVCIVDFVATDGDALGSTSIFVGETGIAFGFAPPIVGESMLFAEISDATTGALLTTMMLICENDEFDDWWEENKMDLGCSTDVPEGTPCLYKFADLEENFENIDLDDGVYFPCWNPYGEDGWELKNKPFIENVAMSCKPVCDSFINDDGTLKDADGTLAMERQILMECEYVWNQECRQWKKPPSDDD